MEEPMEGGVKYARNGNVHIAYRIFGEGPHDLVLIPGTISHVELLWEVPSNEHLLKRLTSFARVIVFDKRGQGLSDRVGEQTLEERIGDVRAVMDAAESDRATIYGWSEGGPMCLMYAATYPARAASLVLYGSFASIKDEPWKRSRDGFEQFLAELAAHWGEGYLLRRNAPSRSNDASFLHHWSRIERAAASPGSIQALMRANYELDVRHILPTIHGPTLILHRAEDKLVPVEAGRYLAEHIPGARYVEIPGTDHMIVDIEAQDIVADEIEEFITGSRHRLEEPDRVLATIMFADMARSTERAVSLGDARWRDLLNDYYGTLRKELAAFRGREVNTAGDGVLATFDGPARAIRCARSVREKVRHLDLEVRVGLHTGECEIIGDDIGGVAVHIAARVASIARSNEVLVSSTVKDLVAGSGLQFVDRGAHSLKGIPGDWRLFAIGG
jgi:class 3 adenylate cyclase